MKNLLKSTLYLSVFALAGILFQISCSNSDNKSITNSLTASQNKLIYTKWDTAGQSIWICDYDGTNQTQIPITIPINTQFNNANGNANPKLSPDGQTIFFVVNRSGGGNSIYTCDINGANITEIVIPSIPCGLSIGNAN